LRILQRPQDERLQQELRTITYQLCLRFPVPGLCL